MKPTDKDMSKFAKSIKLDDAQISLTLSDMVRHHLQINDLGHSEEYANVLCEYPLFKSRVSQMLKEIMCVSFRTEIDVREELSKT